MIRLDDTIHLRPEWYDTHILEGGCLIGFSSLFILGVVLGLAWIGLIEATDSTSPGSTRESSRASRTNALISALGAGLVGARLVFVAMHRPYYQDYPLEILALWQGGLSAAGGMIGSILGLVTLSWRRLQTFWMTLDDMAFPALLLSIACWVGSWMDGVAYGRQVSTRWAWLMNSDPFRGQIARWPTQMTGLLLSVSAFLILLRVSPRLPAGVTGALTATLIALILAVVGVFRADPSMLILGQRLDVLAPALLAFSAAGASYYRWIKAENSRR